MKKPVIGITPSCADEKGELSLPLAYLEAVETAGGVPLVLPHTADRAVAEDAVSLCDGFLFSGGPDVDPKLYGESPWYELGRVSPVRDVTDELFFRCAYESGKPILGICRGIQLVNVCMGGTLYQDLGSQFPRQGTELFAHQQSAPRWQKTHSVTAEAGSIAALAYGGEKFFVNSFHHQAVKTPAPGLSVTVVSDDGVIEGLEAPGYGFLVLVQWHPEVMAPQCEGSRALFCTFVDACRER